MIQQVCDLTKAERTTPMAIFFLDPVVLLRPTEVKHVSAMSHESSLKSYGNKHHQEFFTNTVSGPLLYHYFLVSLTFASQMLKTYFSLSIV